MLNLHSRYLGETDSVSIPKAARRLGLDAYAKHAEVTVPSLDDWEKEWEKYSQAKLLPVDFRSPLVAVAQSN